MQINEIKDILKFIVSVRKQNGQKNEEKADMITVKMAEY